MEGKEKMSLTQKFANQFANLSPAMSLTLTTVLGALPIVIPIATSELKEKMRENFCSVVSPADPTSGPGGYARSQQRAKPAVLSCPYEWMK